jgi:hypothetical protein
MLLDNAKENRPAKRRRMAEHERGGTRQILTAAAVSS